MTPHSITAARLAGGAVVIAALLAGCATAPQTAHLTANAPRDLPHIVELTQTPFFPQERHQCGPAALATVLNGAGAQLTPEALVPQTYIPARAGALQIELIAAARQHGYVPFVIEPRLDALLAEVAAGHPVLVLQNLALSWYPRWHYAVVIGYDIDAGEIVLRSGEERRVVMELSRFEHTWARGGHWALVALPPFALPATAGEREYLKAVVALEETGKRDVALAAYQTALSRWPESIVAMMGIGNCYYTLGDRDASALAFRRLLARRPDYAPALNNLAQLLAEKGEWHEAESFARRAVENGGDESPIYHQTLRAIRARRL